jgi:hypothetical protein
MHIFLNTNQVLYRLCIVNEYNKIYLRNCGLWDCDSIVGRCFIQAFHFSGFYYSVLMNMYINIYFIWQALIFMK